MNFSMPALDAFAASQFQGQTLLAEQADRQATIESKQAQTAATLQQNEAQKQALADKASLSKWMQTRSELDAGKATSAADNAKLYTQASQYAAKNGDFEGAAKMSSLAKESDNIATNEMVQLEKAKASKAEDFSTIAQNVALNPSPENTKSLVSAAIAAGVDPSTIPLPTSPDYKAFVNQAALSSMKGADRLKFLDSQREHELTRKAQEEDSAQRQQDRAEARADRAAARNQAAAFQRESLDIRRQMADSAIEKNKAAAKGKESGGAIGFRQTIAAVNYANEVARGLDLVGAMSSGQTAGTFAHMETPTTILKSLESTGTNKITPEMDQIYNTATKGLGLEMGQLATSGSGRAPNKDIIREMGEMVAARKGDTEYERLFKLANAADFAKARMESIPASSDPRIEATRQKAEAALAKYPKPADVYKAALKAGIKAGRLKDTLSAMDRLKGLASAETSTASFKPDAEGEALVEQYATKH